MNFFKNPYRRILQRDYPEPFVALLMFILGLWIWDNYFGKDLGYEPGVEQAALIKIDRDLRLADAMHEDSHWLRSLAGVQSKKAAQQTALDRLNLLDEAKELSAFGREAKAVVKAAASGKMLDQAVLEEIRGHLPTDFIQTSQALTQHQGTWWQARIMHVWQSSMQPAHTWRESYERDGLRLRARAVLINATLWIIPLIGIFFMPYAIRKLWHGKFQQPSGYASGWPLSLGMTIFLVATLAWIGFKLVLEIGIASLQILPPWLAIVLDTAARMLPAMIAIGLLFHRARHVVRIFGLKTRIDWKCLLGILALLVIIDLVLRWTMPSAKIIDPSGGLNLIDAGFWGLILMLTSACIFGPCAEEVLYRGVLFQAFWNRVGLIMGAAISSTIFAVLHMYHGYGLVSVWCFSFICAACYGVSRSLTTVILLHIIYNSMIKLPEWFIYHAPLASWKDWHMLGG